MNKRGISPGCFPIAIPLSAWPCIQYWRMESRQLAWTWHRSHSTGSCCHWPNHHPILWWRQDIVLVTAIVRTATAGAVSCHLIINLITISGHPDIIDNSQHVLYLSVCTSANKSKDWAKDRIDIDCSLVIVQLWQSWPWFVTRGTCGAPKLLCCLISRLQCSKWQTCICCTIYSRKHTYCQLHAFKFSDDHAQ